MSLPRLFVDADACPVREEALRVAARHGLEVFMVSNGGIRPSDDPRVTVVVAPEGPDEADKWIAERIGPRDVCVTNDTPLAAKCLEAGAAALKPTGEAFTRANIGTALAMRDLAADLRAADPLRPARGPKPFARADRGRFLDALERLIQAARRAR